VETATFLAENISTIPLNAVYENVKRMKSEEDKFHVKIYNHKIPANKALESKMCSELKRFSPRWKGVLK